MASLCLATLHIMFLYSDPPLPCHPPSYWLRLFSSQTFSHTNTPTFSNLVFLHTYLPMKMEQKECYGIQNSDTGEFRTWQKFEIIICINFRARHNRGFRFADINVKPNFCGCLLKSEIDFFNCPNIPTTETDIICIN